MYFMRICFPRWLCPCASVCGRGVIPVLTFLAIGLYAFAQGQGGRGGPGRAAGPPPSIADHTAGMQKIDGYFPLYWDERSGNLFLEIPRLNDEFLLTTGLAEGLGSNDIGLDRGLDGGGKLVRFERAGPKIFLVQGNETFRSTSSNSAERQSVEDSFAKSILWGFTVAAESNGHVLVDATDFVVRDGLGAANQLSAGAAAYRVDARRSAVYVPNTRSFPRNTEIEVTLTFASEAAGGRGGRGGGAAGAPAGFGGRGGMFSGSVGSVTPTADSVTLREHYSLVELPDGNYKPRYDDPRAGYGGLSYVDYSVPIGEPMVKHFLHRHRLEKKDPNADVSEPVKPIEYWVDRGAPEDVRQALIEGASWWNQAFEAAGFRNAFKVAVLPEGADPMDIRYNMIYWVHRSTRGWSYGSTVSDPRTGEIIKGIVRLGSLRDRQDYLIFEGLLSPYLNGNEKPDILYQAALARIRQLAAHETGHTLGLSHNYYDSTAGWISVMDYPHPQDTLRADGSIDLSHAYPVGIGEWDKVAINYGYRQLPPGDEQAALTRILDDAWVKDIRYLTNQDADTHPRVDQWSLGVNQADELHRIMQVRRAALNRLGVHTIRNGAPMATIEEPLVPIFLYHRYSVESAAHAIGGQDYIYAIRGDGRKPVQWETPDNQRKALTELAATLKPSELTVPQAVLDAIPPRPPGFGPHRELFPRTTGPAFDPVSPATVASDVTIGFVLEPARMARVVSQHALDAKLPGMEEVVDDLVKATFGAATQSAYEAEVKRAEERVLADRLMGLASGAPNDEVRAIAAAKLTELQLRARSTPLDSFSAALSADIDRFLKRPADPARPMALPIPPPGAPIGGDTGMDWLLLPDRCRADW